jgi:hypothetical protein
MVLSILFLNMMDLCPVRKFFDVFVLTVRMCLLYQECLFIFFFCKHQNGVSEVTLKFRGFRSVARV